MKAYKPPKIHTLSDFLLIMSEVKELKEEDILNADSPNTYARFITLAIREGQIERFFKHDPTINDPKADPLIAYYRLTESGERRVKIIKHERRL